MDKCDFLTTIKYLEHKIDKNGLKSDPARATAIKENMPPPTSVSILQEIMSLWKKKSNHENNIFSCDGILLYGERVVIPASPKKKY